jgi:outer membrane protein assembly factor BamE (lipoprotein component of BamABCDE complex)
VVLTTGCNLIYKMNIQQGNALEQEDLDQLELGMNKNQVSFLLGTPAVQDPFHQDRWDYVSSFSRRGGDPVRRLVTLEFENDTLQSMTGVRAGSGEEVLTEGGAEKVTGAIARVGINVEDARNYEDLEILSDGLPDWSLQYGSFTYRSDADRLLAELNEDGINATIYGQVIGDVGFFILRAGSYDSRDATLSAAAEIEQSTGRKPFVVTPGT